MLKEQIHFSKKKKKVSNYCLESISHFCVITELFDPSHSFIAFIPNMKYGGETNLALLYPGKFGGNDLTMNSVSG